MAQKSRWATIEGGIANSFPLSINRTAYWTALRRGECYDQDHCDFERIGLLSYIQKPSASPLCVIKKFAEEAYSDDYIVQFLAYGRWWKVDIANPTKLLYSDVWTEGDPVFGENNVLVFEDDGTGPIKLVAPDGTGRIFVLKDNCGFVISEADREITSWRRSAPEYGIGSSYDEPSYTNALINGYVATAWNVGDASQNRHFLWNGTSVVELSEDIRSLTDADTTKHGLVNWAKRLVIFGPFVYDYDRKRVFRYSGAAKAAMTSRPYFESNFSPLVIHRLAFICDGKNGTFKATIEYGQSEDNLNKSQSFEVSVRDVSKQRFRHVWNLELPVVCRVWRVSISDLTGVGIVQIDADVSVADSPDDADGTQ